MGAFRTVVFLYRVPVYLSILKRYCTYELPALGYRVVIADLTYVVDPRYDNAATKERITDDKERQILYKKLLTVHDIEMLVAKYWNKAFFFPMFSDCYETRRVYRLFTAYGVKFGCIGSMCADISVGMENKPLAIPMHERLSPNHIKKAFYNRIWRKVRRQKEAELIGYGAKKGQDFYRGMYPCGKKTKQLSLYTFDYENFLLSEPYCHERKYCVFLDQYIPYHPDNTSYKIFQTVNASEYYGQLNIIFDNIKKWYRLDIIVAAHPKADYAKKRTFKEDILIKYQMTAALVKNAEFVMAHFSTAIDYAVMAWKPILILKLPEVAKFKVWRAACEGYEKMLGLHAVTDGHDIKGDMPIVDFVKYHRFLQEYVFCVEQQKPGIWEKIMDVI